MKPADYAFFKENGYISLGKILSDAEVEHLFISLTGTALKLKITGIVLDITRPRIAMHF